MRRPQHIRLFAALLVFLALVCAGVIVLSRRLSPPPLTPAPSFPPVRFTDVTAAAGIAFRHTNGMAGKKLLPETMGSGVVVFDYDGDGWDDLFFVNSRPWPGDPGPRATQALYRNNHDGTFTDVTVAAGLDVELFGMGATAADYDDDGKPDLFLTAVGGNRLFRNLGGKFVDVTDAAGVGGPSGDTFPSSATWLDYDGDGNPDLFVCFYLTWSPAADLAVRAVLPNGTRAYVPPTQFPGAECVLYRNLGNGTFADVSAAAAVQVADVGPDGKRFPVGKPLGVVAWDPDRDGFPDLIVACDTVRNFFFHNVPDGKGGRRFTEIGLSANVAYSDGHARGGMGVDVAELAPNGFAAVIVNFANEPLTLLDRRQQSPLRFADMAASWGLAGPSRAPMKFGTAFLDYDLDGRPDLFTANGHLEPDIAGAQAGQTHAQAASLFRNTGNEARPWEPVTAEAVGPDLFVPMVGRGCAVFDYDHDGDLDLIVTVNGGPPKLFRNDNATGNRWLAVELVGKNHREPLGAEVRVEAGGRTWTQYRTAARGYMSQSTSTHTFGLGSTPEATVTIRWPGGVEQTWPTLAAGRYRLTEGVPGAEKR